MGTQKEERAIGARGFLISGMNGEYWFRVYKPNDPEHSFVDYEITHHDCEIVIIDPSAALFHNDAGSFLDYTTDSMEIVK